MSLFQFLLPFYKIAGVLTLIALSYLWGNWNGYVEGLRMKQE